MAVVDDDGLFRESLEQNLRDAGFETIAFADGPEALAYFAGGGEADLVVLDWKMPGMNGIEVLRRLRGDGRPVPVIFLTALTDQIFEEAALGSGAIDFVEKTRSFSILRHRIELIVGGAKGRGQEAPPRPETKESPSLRIGDLELSLDSHRALWRNRHVELTLAEFHMVHLLAARAGKDVDYRELYDVVHGEGFIAGEGPEGYRANVRTFIKRIREKFRDADSTFDRIQNYPGFGYQWLPDNTPPS